MARYGTKLNMRRVHAVSRLCGVSCPAGVPGAVEGKRPALRTHKTAYKTLLERFHRPFTPPRRPIQASLPATSTLGGVSPAPAACGHEEDSAVWKESTGLSPRAHVYGALGRRTELRTGARITTASRPGICQNKSLRAYHNIYKRWETMPGRSFCCLPCWR